MDCRTFKAVHNWEKRKEAQQGDKAPQPDPARGHRSDRDPAGDDEETPEFQTPKRTVAVIRLSGRWEAMTRKSVPGSNSARCPGQVRHGSEPISRRTTLASAPAAVSVTPPARNGCYTEVRGWAGPGKENGPAGRHAA